MQPSETIRYNATFRHGVDGKRRLQIPAMWLPTEGSVEFTLIVWPKYKEGHCLRVLPPKEMDKLMAKLDGLADGSSQKTVLKRLIGSKSAQVVADKAGRICLPEEMAKAANLKAEVVLVGMLDKFEIWNPDAYTKIKVADEVMSAVAFDAME